MLPISGSFDGPGGRGASPAVVLADVITMTIARIMHTTATASEIDLPLDEKFLQLSTMLICHIHSPSYD